MDRLAELWKTNKWMFFLLVIPLGIAGVYSLLMDANVKGAKKDVKEAEKQDGKLKEEEDRAKAVADKLKNDADKIEEEINNITPDEDWNK